MSDEVYGIELIKSPSRQFDEARRLRGEVYTEMRFIREEELVDGMDQDEDDDRSIQIGAFDLLGQLVGTIRVIMPDETGLPINKYFHDIEISGSAVEISRYAILDQHRGIAVAAALTRAACHVVAEHGKDDMYAVMEKELLENLEWMGFPFRKLSERPQNVYESENYPTCCRQSQVVDRMRERDQARKPFPQLAPFFEAPFEFGAVGIHAGLFMFKGVQG